MYKIEIVHSKMLLDHIKDLVEEEIIEGHTSLKIEKSYGQFFGGVENSYIDGENYYTFILSARKSSSIVKTLKERAPEERILAFVTEVKLL